MRSSADLAAFLVTKIGLHRRNQDEHEALGGILEDGEAITGSKQTPSLDEKLEKGPRVLAMNVRSRQLSRDATIYRYERLSKERYTTTHNCSW